jgi:predicted nucleotidyltransferase
MASIGLTDEQLGMLRALFHRAPAIREVILFGSRAKGNQRPESDVDLVLVGIDDALTAEAVTEALESLPMPFKFDVKAEGDIRYTPLKAHIQRVGMTIYCRDDGAVELQDPQARAAIDDGLAGLGLTADRNDQDADAHGK